MTSQSHHHPTRRRWGLSIRDQIVAVVAAVLVPGLLLGAWLVFQSARAQAEQIELQAASDAREIATLIDRELVSSMNMLTALASSYTLQSGDMNAFHAGLDVFAMISEPAGCPNASLEAMAAALPVVATNVGGACEQYGKRPSVK